VSLVQEALIEDIRQRPWRHRGVEQRGSRAGCELFHRPDQVGQRPDRPDLGIGKSDRRNRRAAWHRRT